MKAVIPAAGLGTRFLPATKASPKEMLPVVDKPAIQYVVEECVAAGIKEICIVTGRGKRAIEDHFDQAVELERLLEQKGDSVRLEQLRAISEMADIYYVRQRAPKGLGHAVACARSFVAGEPFAVLLGDDIMEAKVSCTKQLVDWHRRTKGGSVIAVEPVPRARLSSYGVIKPRREVEPGLHEVEDLVEKPKPEEAPSDLGIMGRYVLDGSIMDHLANTQPGRGGEIQLTDAMRLLVKQSPLFAWRFEGRRHDLGHKLGWLMANVEYGLKDAEVGADLRRFLRGLP
ncbi:MAG TPA: UTP--glucose-1-phosphate uridylyltransferase GalU [Candidatus Thermoplasmatota archaeon]|nr:UTP--glucose-1-phosphate uridylyltransferase GalU [Candidatus Thermoplasmatota archaeon]